MLTGAVWTGVLTHLDSRFGGLSTAVPELSRQVAAVSGCEMRLAAFCSADEVFAEAPLASLQPTIWPASRKPWLLDQRLRRSFSDLIVGGSGVHIHGLWEQSTAMAASAAQRHGMPYVVSPHGMLEPWALRQKALKKKIYAALVERHFLERAACLHALTAAEAQDLRRFGCTAPIAVIPNGVAIAEPVSPNLFLERHPELAGKRVILFLSRLHKKKGLELLLQSWRDVAGHHPDARLVLAGPDSDGTQAEIESQIATLGLRDSVALPGMLREELKWSALAAAEGYVLPSFSEGLSMSVLEAMGSGLPVVLSRHCNLPEVAEIGAGAVIPADIESLRRALLELLERSSEQNATIGARGRRHVLEHYSWASVAREMSRVYSWLGGGGERPASVLPDDATSARGVRR